MTDDELNYGQKKTKEYAEKTLENRNHTQALDSEELAEKTHGKIVEEEGHSPVKQKTMRSYLTNIVKDFNGFSDWVGTFRRREGQGAPTRYYYDKRTEQQRGELGE